MILITGSISNAGKKITEKLLAEGKKIRTLDLEAYKSPLPGVEHITCPNLDIAHWKKALTGVDTVIHLLDLRKRGYIKRGFVKKINIGGVKNLLLAARNTGLKKIVFMSSYEVYGDQKKIPTAEDIMPRPATMYGKDKLRAEKLFALLIKNNTFDITILRPALIVGPGTDDPMILITLFMAMAMEEDNRLYMAGDGDNRFQMIDPGEIADAVSLVLKNNASRGKTYNLGSDSVPTQIEQIVKMKESARLNCMIKRMSAAFAKFLSFVFRPMKINYLTKEHVRYLTTTMMLDCQRAKSELGWITDKDNIQILSDTIDWYKKEKL